MEGDGMKVAVVILNWNGKHDTVACLKSLETSSQVPFHTIVVDNGSQDDSVVEIRKQFPHISVLETGSNLGYAGGNNHGIQEALKYNVDGVLLLNNDTLVEPGFIEAFIHSCKTHPEVGIWGGYPLRFHSPGHLDHLGGIWNSEKADFDLIGLNAPRGFQTDLPLDYVCGCSIFIRREVFEKIGLLEPKFFLFWEEADFAMHAKKVGFKIGICKQAVLHHKVSASFIGGSPHKKYFWWRSRLLWIERNCSPEEKDKLFDKLIQLELWHYKKLYGIKRIELALLQLIGRKNLQEKQQKLKQYRAILQGIRDYQAGNFGAGPVWLFDRK